MKKVFCIIMLLISVFLSINLISCSKSKGACVISNDCIDDTRKLTCNILDGTFHEGNTCAGLGK